MTPAGPVPSPCNSVCRIDGRSGWCLGCRRTIAEIAAWSTLSEADKRALCEALPQRRAELAPSEPQP